MCDINTFSSLIVSILFPKVGIYGASSFNARKWICITQNKAKSNQNLLDKRSSPKIVRDYDFLIFVHWAGYDQNQFQKSVLPIFYYFFHCLNVENHEKFIVLLIRNYEVEAISGGNC